MSRLAFPRSVLPRSLAGQFTLLLALALLVANIAALFLFSSEQGRVLRNLRRSAQVERIVNLVPALNAMAPGLRADVVRAISGRRTRLSVDPEALVSEDQAGDVGTAVAEVIGDRLDLPEGLTVRIAIREPDPDRAVKRAHQRPGERAGKPGRWLHHRGIRMDISIPLADGSWLNSRQVPASSRPPLPGRAILILLGLSFLAVLAVGLWFIRRLTTPIKALGEAAQRAGRGDREARVAETGASEIRDASRAFNAMQGEIARFEAERARTVAAIGHDLRTPITSLRIRTEMLDDETQREPMIRTLDEMRVMADGLLRWGHNEAEAEPVETIDLAALLRDLCGQDAASGMHFVGPAGLAIAGRPVALRRAFSNLIENAERYAGGASIRLAAAGSRAVVTIEDEGPGFPPDQLDGIFEPFVRGETSRSTDTGGAGLGLSIVRSIVRSHGGTVSVANREGRSGLVVEVSLPMEMS